MDAEPKSNVRPDATPELPLCLGCAQPNDPAANFCSHCGAPMTSYASTGPFESLFAEGRAYREAADHPRSPVVVAGVWLLFGMMFLGGLLLTSPALHGDFLIAIPGLLLMGLSLTMLIKTTRNFLAGRESRGARIGDPDEDAGVPLP
ncbi:MAG: zinc ribbon domain-containing protein [Verrucomicrobiales bacterium]|nr:zinc ribbon domain-containing protein [Verrucomicrobiales bacterium]